MSDRPITRETFINPDYERIAATETETMVKGMNEETGELMTVKVPRSIKQSGKIPEGYSVGELILHPSAALGVECDAADFIMDPIMIVGFVNSMGMKMER